MKIRTYRNTDKERLRFICKETAWDSYKKNAKKLESVAIMFNDYFTENERENIFVLADDHDIAVGYIVCSANYEKFVRLNKSVYKKRVLKTAPLQVFFLEFFLFNLKKIKSRPIHFHMNLLPEYQRQGWGSKLMDALCRHLKNNGYSHLSGCCIRRNSGGYKMYRKYGFREIYDHGHGVVSISLDL